jgi:basic membrane protein A and related proteins
MNRNLFLTVFVMIVILLFSFSGCKGAKKDSAKYKIGMVFDIGGKGDKSFNDSAYAGFVKVAKDNKGFIDGEKDNDFGKEVALKYLEPKSGGQDREQLLRVLAEEKYNLIIGVGFAFTDSMAKVAKDFPDTHFAIIDGFIPDLTDASNITCLSFNEHEGSFLVGAAAGLLNEKGKLGFLGGMDIPLIHKFQAGYIAGAMYVNKDLRKDGMILSQYIGKGPEAFKDAPSAYNIASSMYKQGVTIIYHASGASGDGLFKAAEEAKKLAIGVDSDQGYAYATASDDATKTRAKFILTSMTKRVDNAVIAVSSDMIKNGKVKGGYISYGVKDDGVGIAENEFNKDLLAGIKPKIDELKSKIISGEIQIPDHESKIKDWAKTALK